MPSSWIITRHPPACASRKRNGGGECDCGKSRRFRVEYRTGGAGSATRYGGSFRRKEDALARKRWIDGELASLRIPDLHLVEEAPTRTLRVEAERWRQSRVDVSEGTAQTYRVAIARLDKQLGDIAIDKIDAPRVAALVSDLHADGLKKQTIRKTVSVLAMVLDYAGVRDNPARDKQTVKLPREERRHVRRSDASSRGSARTGTGLRSPVRAPRPGFRRSRRTTFATGASHCCISPACRGRGSASSSAMTTWLRQPGRIRTSLPTSGSSTTQRSSRRQLGQDSSHHRGTFAPMSPELDDQLFEALTEELRGREVHATRVERVHIARGADADGNPALFVQLTLTEPPAGSETWPSNDVLRLRRLVRDALLRMLQEDTRWYVSFESDAAEIASDTD